MLAKNTLTEPEPSTSALIAEIFEAEMTDFAPARQFICWRLVRRQAEMSNTLSRDESLAEATQARRTTEDFTAFWTARHQLTGPMPADMLNIVRKANSHGGLPLLPPEEEVLLGLWCDFRRRLADLMGLDRPHPLHPRMFTYGSKGLFDPEQAIKLTPDPIEIVAYEEVTVLQAQTILIEDGTLGAIKRYQTELGLNHAESRAMVDLARASISEQMYAGLEDNRMLVAARLEDFINRSKAQYNFRGEIDGITRLAMVLGLTRGEADDPLKEIGRVITKVADEDKTKPKALPAK